VKYMLVDKLDNINTTVELASDVGLGGARTYFLGVKKIEQKEFDRLWIVMSENDYENQFKLGLQDRQNEKLKYEWWLEDKEIVDDELKI